jgi:hypothetical protein
LESIVRLAAQVTSTQAATGGVAQVKTVRSAPDSEIMALMSLQLFNGADPSQILAALHRDRSPEEVMSLQFRSDAPRVRSVDMQDQWLRLKSILGCATVYDAFGISSLPVKPPAVFHYAVGLEAIGTLANLLVRGGVHQRFVDDNDAALSLSRCFLDKAFLGRYDAAEAYSCRGPWCDWFVGEGILDETVLIGNLGEWWLLATTGTD